MVTLTLRDWIPGEGRLIYDPKREGLHKTHRAKWWVVIHIDPEICVYYRDWVRREYSVILQGSAWHPHITVTGDVEPLIKEAWGYRRNEILKFEYCNYVYCPWEPPGPFFCVKVRSPDIEDVRNNLGFDARDTKKGCHITIGRRNDWDIAPLRNVGWLPS